jgi:hypothetical protein
MSTLLAAGATADARSVARARLELWLEEMRLALRRERTPLLVVCLLTLVAKFSALLPGYSVDDYWTAGSGPYPGLLYDVLSKGRYGHWVFLKLAMALQVEPNAAQVLYVLASVACYSVFGLAVVRFWGVSRAGWLPVAAAAIIANHPYTCEIFTFRIGLPLAAMVLFLLAITLFLCSRRRSAGSPLPRLELLVSALLVATALSLYPIALHFAGMIVLLALALELGRSLRSTGTAPEAGSAGRPQPWVLLLAATLLGTGLYALVGLALKSVLRLDASYFALIPFAEAGHRLLRAAIDVARTFVGSNVLIPPLVRALFALVLAAALATLAARALRRAPRWRALSTLAAIGGLLGLALFWMLGIFLILTGYWLSPRNMAQAGILWAGGLILAAEALSSRGARTAITVAAFVILLSFLGVNQEILSDQLRLNRQDMLQASRIVGRLESLGQIEKVRRVAFVGSELSHPSRPRTMAGSMNVSAFSAVWSQVPVLEEASGYDWEWSTDPAEKAAARAFCAAAPRWPAPGSVAIEGEIAIVCMKP